jgi:hypothetical protein
MIAPMTQPRANGQVNQSGTDERSPSWRASRALGTTTGWSG